MRLFDNYHAEGAPGKDFRYFIENRFLKKGATAPNGGSA